MGDSDGQKETDKPIQATATATGGSVGNSDGRQANVTGKCDWLMRRENATGKYDRQMQQVNATATATAEGNSEGDSGASSVVT